MHLVPQKIHERKGPSREIIQKCEPHERHSSAPRYEERTPEETSRQEAFVRKAAWDLAKNVYKLKNNDKTAFYSRGHKGADIDLKKKTQEERMFVIDSGASMHMLNKKDLSSDELDTLRRSRNPTRVVTANGEVQTNEEAQENVHDLDLFVTVQLLDDTPAVLSLGELCSEHGYSCEWITGQQPQLTKHGHKITCKTDIYAPLVVPGLSSSSGSSSSSTSRPQDQSQNSGESASASSDPVTNRRDKPAVGNRMPTDPDKPAAGNRKQDTQDEKDTEDPTQEVPEWLQNFTANLEDLEKHVPTHVSERENSDSEASTKVVDKSKLRKRRIYTHFPKDRNCDVCFEDQNYEVPMQETP